MFGQCNFTTFNVPNGVITISQQCFIANKNLKTVTLPDSIESIEGGAFSNCHPNLVISFQSYSKLFIDNQFVIYGDLNTTLTNYIPNNSNKEIIVLSTVKIIKSYAFFENTNIISIKFPLNNYN